MAGFGDFESKGQVFYQGKLLAYCSGVDVDGQGNGSDVNTMHLGYAGEAAGPQKWEVTLTNVIPVAGMEADFDQHFIDRKTVSAVVARGGSRMRFTGKLSNVRSSNSIESAAEYTATLVSGTPDKI